MSKIGATYECKKCGLRVVVTKTGNDTPPIHCGDEMVMIHEKAAEMPDALIMDPAMRG